MKKINIVVTSDDSYIQHLGCMLISLFNNAANPQLVHIYFLDHGVNTASRNSVINICSKYKAEVHFINIDPVIFENFYISGHVNQVSYYRILAPEILPNSIKRFIYLDSDLIISGDIESLYDTDLREQIIGAVLDPIGSERFSDLNISNKRYFNAGVLVVDIEKWKESDITVKTLDFIKNFTGELKFWDQDALNAVLFDSWSEVDISWNVQTSMFVGDEYRESVSVPQIIHYTSEKKPWNIICNHPFKEQYYVYLAQSEWKDFSPIPYEVRQLLKANKKIAIFGTGELARAFFNLVDGEQVICFVDNNKSKQGTLFLNKEVIAPNSLHQYRDCFIIVCSFYYEEIKVQLEGLQYIEDSHFYKISAS